MAIAGVNNYTDYYTDTKKKSVSESTETMDKQKTEKPYSNQREYKTYLTEKYGFFKFRIINRKQLFNI